MFCCQNPAALYYGNYTFPGFKNVLAGQQFIGYPPSPFTLDPKFLIIYPESVALISSRKNNRHHFR